MNSRKFPRNSLKIFYPYGFYNLWIPTNSPKKVSMPTLTVLLDRNALHNLSTHFTKQSYLLISSAGFTSIPAASLSTATKSRKHASQNSILSQIGDLCLCNPSNRYRRPVPVTPLPAGSNTLFTTSPP